MLGGWLRNFRGEGGGVVEKFSGGGGVVETFSGGSGVEKCSGG